MSITIIYVKILVYRENNGKNRSTYDFWCLFGLLFPRKKYKKKLKSPTKIESYFQLKYNFK